MAIVKVLGVEGEVLHDCIEAGCSVSWDGVALVDGLTTPKGEKVPGSGTLDSRWHLLADGETVQATHA